MIISLSRFYISYLIPIYRNSLFFFFFLFFFGELLFSRIGICTSISSVACKTYNQIGSDQFTSVRKCSRLVVVEEAKNSKRYISQSNSYRTLKSKLIWLIIFQPHTPLVFLFLYITHLSSSHLSLRDCFSYSSIHQSAHFTSHHAPSSRITSPNTPLRIHRDQPTYL